MISTVQSPTTDSIKSCRNSTSPGGWLPNTDTSLLRSYKRPKAAAAKTPAPALATRSDDVIGIWQWVAGFDGIPLFFQFDEDGTWRHAKRIVTNLEDSPVLIGSFMLEGGLMTIATSDESPLCAGQSGTYEARLLEQGRLDFSQRFDRISIWCTID